MNAAGNSLFRPDAIRYRADRLHGDVGIAVPLSWQVIGYSLIAAVAVAGVFLNLASYSRVETVAGSIVLDRGIAPIVPSRAGVVEAVEAREGQHVAPGQVLVRIRAEEDTTNGATTPARMLAAVRQQDARLASQTALVLAAASADRARLAAQARGLKEEIAILDVQIATQRRLVQVAEGEYRVAKGVAAKGFISQRDLNAREADLLTREQQLSRLQQARAEKEAAIIEAARASVQSAATAEAQAASVLSARAELGRHVAEADASRGYALSSPIAGTVTAVTVRLGQPASLQQSVMTVVPDGAVTRAELYVPTAAAGFLAVGQDVRLAVDAFPYERFGTVDARIMQISAVTVARTAGDGTSVPVYLVTAAVPHPWMMAFGRRQKLLPGMTLTGRIIAEKQSLFRWLLQPLFAVRNR
jgi:membrane fusion protein